MNTELATLDACIAGMVHRHPSVQASVRPAEAQQDATIAVLDTALTCRYRGVPWTSEEFVVQCDAAIRAALEHGGL